MGKTIRKRITDSDARKLGSEETIRDTDISGFGVRRRSGKPKYFLHTRVNGRLRWMTIGEHGVWTAGKARKEAKRLLLDIGVGIDPQAEKQARKNIPTFAEEIESFKDQHCATLSARSQGEYISLIDKILVPQFGKLPITEIDYSVVSKWHTSKNMRTRPYRANFALRVLSAFLNWTEDKKLRPKHSNPCPDIKFYRERKIENYLTYEEFAKLGEVLEEAEAGGTETPWTIAAIRLYIFLGARKSEILTLKWDYVDFRREVLRLPESKTGKKVIDLNPASIKVLHEVPRVEGNPYVIVGNVPGKHLVGIQKQWNRLRKQAGISIRLHDLRHSYASAIADQPDANLIKLGKLLGHKNVQTTARYAHLFKDSELDLNKRTTEKLADIVWKKRKKQS